MRGVRRTSVARTGRGRRPRPKKTSGCGCEVTLELLAREGGPHARSVLAGHHTDVRFFTARDWTLHMREEEIVFGRLFARGFLMRAFMARIAADHDEIRRQLRRHGRVDPGFARRHARFEDATVAKLLRPSPR